MHANSSRKLIAESLTHSAFNAIPIIVMFIVLIGAALLFLILCSVVDVLVVLLLFV